MRTELRGTGVALVTPFHQDKSVDYDSLSRLIDHVIGGEVDYVVSLGTTGESATLSSEEQDQVLAHTIGAVDQRVPVVAGFGGNNTEAVINRIKGASLDGVAAILSVSPYYNKPTQQGIYNHYKALDDVSPLPIILYNVPGRTASNLTAETTIRLAKDCANIMAIKEASGDLSQCMDIVANAPEGFLVISGEDELTLPMISFGMHGVISVIANAFPKAYSDMVRLAREGNFAEATEIQFRLLRIMRLLFTEGNPGGVKCALKLLDVCGDTVRLPLANVSAKTEDALKAAISATFVEA